MSCELIIVDNASTDSTREIVNQKFPHLRLRENSKNIGFAGAVNEGFSASIGKNVLLLNPDAVLGPNFLKELSCFLQGNPQVDIVGCKILRKDGKPERSCWKTPSLKTVMFEMLLPHKLSIRLIAESPNQKQDVEIVSGACMAVRRDVFEHFRGFDPRFFLYYEDADFCYRARQAGLKVYFYPEITVTHLLSRSSSQDMRSFFIHLYKSKLLFIQKHYSRPHYLLAWSIVCIGLLLRGLTHLIVGVLSFNRQWFQLAKYQIIALSNTIR